MAQSAEYPDLAMVVPNAYGTGRDGKSVMYAVVHYTAGAERNTSAEDGAAYDARRTDGVSTHYFHDSNSTVQCVYTQNRANAAFHKGNRLGIQHELCGTVQTRAQWLDPASDGTLWRAAKQIARDCVKYGLPVRRLTTSQVRAAWYSWPNGPKGICGHVDVTNAYPEDGGTHTDPGAEFPWDVLLERVAYYVNGDDEMDVAHAALLRAMGEDWAPNEAEYLAAGGVQATWDAMEAAGMVGGNGRINKDGANVKKLVEDMAALTSKVDDLAADVAELATGGVTHEALVAALTDPAVIAAMTQAATAGAEAAEDS